MNDQTKSAKEDAPKKAETGKVTFIQSIFQFFNARKSLFVIKLNLKVKEPKALHSTSSGGVFCTLLHIPEHFPLRGKRDIIIQH